MTALAESADYATASLYTYLARGPRCVAALQERALRVLNQVAEDALLGWDALLAGLPAPNQPNQGGCAQSAVGVSRLSS